MANENNILNFVQNFFDTVYRYIHQFSDFTFCVVAALMTLLETNIR